MQNVVGAVHWIISNQKDKSDRSDSGLNQAGVTSVWNNNESSDDAFNVGSTYPSMMS